MEFSDEFCALYKENFFALFPIKFLPIVPHLSRNSNNKEMQMVRKLDLAIVRKKGCT